MPSGFALADAMQPLVATVGGGAAIGSVLGVAWAMCCDADDWSKTAAYGSVGGALLGSMLLAIDIATNIG